MADSTFPVDPRYKGHYVHHRTLPPRFVQSEAERDYLIGNPQKGIRGLGWKTSYLHQEWPQARYHKDFSIAIERRPDIEDLDERPRQLALAARNKQRQRAIRIVPTQAAADRLGADWMVYADLPDEKKRLKQEADENAADNALYGGITDELDEEPVEEAVVMGEPLRRGPGRPRRNV